MAYDDGRLMPRMGETSTSTTGHSTFSSTLRFTDGQSPEARIIPGTRDGPHKCIKSCLPLRNWFPRDQKGRCFAKRVLAVPREDKELKDVRDMAARGPLMTEMTRSAMSWFDSVKI
ncbi:hypothetical protein AAL_01536 [Moelleriella libera RCEF 2490]|uniref:Uncharacterized protein n=1 Tax=Moelleriella libera RCEF 2490 TaxID=1081109 RepID=A0A166U8Q8_9HYPO|nr:hypothetical protein AAL_01536 [Moelleriella libera RCEF 2490]